jgi:MYXO-CTERM domain-containing protein
LWEGNVAPQAYQDQTHGGKLSETYFRNFLTGWESCSNGNCSPNATAKNANLDAVSPLAFNRYGNFVANVLGTPGVSTLAYVYTDPSQFWSSSNGLAHIWNLGSGNQAVSLGGPIPVDPAVLSSTMWFHNWDAFNSATMDCTGPGTPVAGCPQDQRASNAPTYPGLSHPSTTMPPSFYYGSRPAWWSSAIPFPAIGPDVTGGNVGQCTGTLNTSGQYGGVPATSSAQCTGTGMAVAWDGHVNAIPAMNCFLNVMGGPPDGTGGVLTFDADNCYSSTIEVDGGVLADGGSPGMDGGAAGADGGSAGIDGGYRGTDAGSLPSDGGPGAQDTGGMEGTSSGCGCRTIAGGELSVAWGVPALVLLFGMRRRARSGEGRRRSN